MYTGYLLSDNSRKILMETFPPKYPDVIAHHITETFGVPANHPPPQSPDSVEVIGYVDNSDGVEGLVVSINGNTDRPSGGTYHITWSIDKSKGYKPFHTNNYLSNFSKLDSTIPIEVIPQTFKK